MGPLVRTVAPQQPVQPLDYLTRGSRPFHLQFPPCVARLRASYQADFEGVLKYSISESGRQISANSTQAETCSTSGTTDWNDEFICVKAPDPLHAAFDFNDVKPWDPGLFQLVGKMQDATRNKGQVHRMQDIVLNKSVAVKQMPNDWMRGSPEEFHRAAPAEIEHPWTDIGCVSFLNACNYPYACSLFGVYRDSENTHVVTELATEGDLFEWSGTTDGPPPGPAREAVILPLAKQIIKGIAQLHEMSLVHHDLSLENFLLSRNTPHGNLTIKVIDFGMTAPTRHFSNCVRGKPSYQAPEVHAADEEYDGFLSDAFALGVTLYACLTKDYPWLSTRPGGCKCFEFVRKNGFRAYINKRKLRGTSQTIAYYLSESLIQLLEGLLAFNPAERLTLGEAVFADSGRKSVWDQPWLRS